MALAIPTPSDGSSVLLRFGGVEVDAARHRLTVDGREVRVQRLVFNLALALCEAQGRVLPRDELFAKLWPDGSFPADESLSQLVFKLRSALGPYGGAVVTVRQVGVRLEADVEQVPVPGSAGVPGSVAVPGSADVLAGNSSRADEDVGAPRRRHLGKVVAALVVLFLVAGMIATRFPEPVVVSAGFGLDSIEVQASDARTIETLQRAFAADAEGKQSAARVLMETAHAADPSTPVPSMFLTYWYGGVGDAAAAERWAAERDLRIGPHTPTYVALLARLLSIRDAPALDRLKLESLLLETEPSAALIRLSRAHHHLQRNERELALEHLQQVDLRAVGRRRAPIVLGDLAALGAGKTVEQALESAGDALDAPGRAYAQARLSVSQGRYADARTFFDRTLMLAKLAERPDLVRGSALHAAMMSAELGEFEDARHRLEQSIQALRDERAYTHAWHSTLVLATLPNVADAEARDLLQRLADEVPAGARSELCLDVELVAALLRLDAPPALRCAAGHSDQYARRGGSALTEGLRAELAGDPAAARTALARAESEGVRDTVLAPYAELLVARLNGTVQKASVPDPPYPVWHRWALRWREAPLGAPASPPARAP
jgi:DNA-binding winged helix-turn-helix (wHTH) protein/tetratricopeptide (TPR) repeat protein